MFILDEIAALVDKGNVPGWRSGNPKGARLLMSSNHMQIAFQVMTIGSMSTRRVQERRVEIVELEFQTDMGESEKDFVDQILHNA
jgi:hypothetical protein